MSCLSQGTDQMAVFSLLLLDTELSLSSMSGRFFGSLCNLMLQTTSLLLLSNLWCCFLSGLHVPCVLRQHSDPDFYVNETTVKMQSLVGFCGGQVRSLFRDGGHVGL